MVDGPAMVDSALNPHQNPDQTSRGGLVLGPFYRHEYRSKGPICVRFAGRFFRDWHGAA